MTVNSDVLSVSALVALLQDVVEDNFVQVLVEGEIANFATPASGHWYFTLKDETAQMRAVMFRTQNRLLPFRPESGMKVLCRGRMSVYLQRGEVQLVLEGMEPSGLGSLQLAFEQLRKRLDAEGLFAPEHKRPLPPFPATVGVVTSATGAAIHDILNVLRRRSAGVRVLIRPVKVQGEGAAGEIAAGIAEMNQHGQADVLIVGRGGGGIEDLWAFNEETVARAIYESQIPVISAVGHEVDTTIADYVADLRAPTPSAAAELVVKERLALENHLDHLTMRMASQMRSRVQRLKDRLDAMRAVLRSPAEKIDLARQHREDLERRLNRAVLTKIGSLRQLLGMHSSRLDALSPLKVLGRGYSIAFDERDGTVVRNAAAVQTGQRLRLRFARGQCRVVVEATETED